MAARDISGLCDLWGTLYSSWFHSSRKQSPFFKSERRGKGTKVSHALRWVGSKMYLVSPLQPSYQVNVFFPFYSSACSLLFCPSLLTLLGAEYFFSLHFISIID